MPWFFACAIVHAQVVVLAQRPGRAVHLVFADRPLGFRERHLGRQPRDLRVGRRRRRFAEVDQTPTIRRRNRGGGRRGHVLVRAGNGPNAQLGPRPVGSLFHLLQEPAWAEDLCHASYHAARPAAPRQAGERLATMFVGITRSGRECCFLACRGACPRRRIQWSVSSVIYWLSLECRDILHVGESRKALAHSTAQ